MSRQIACLTSLGLFLSSSPSTAQQWDVEKTTAPATTRLDFVATEGTWMSLDVAPDGVDEWQTSPSPSPSPKGVGGLC